MSRLFFSRSCFRILLAFSLALGLAACGAKQAVYQTSQAPRQIGQKAFKESALAASAKAQELQKRLAALVADPKLGGSRIGVYVQALNDEQALFKHNPHQQFIPASNQKLYTTAAALSLLGPNYRYETELLAAGPLKSGTLAGDLLVKGSGDPSISSRASGGMDSTFRQWARELRKQGVNVIAGDLVADASLFEKPNFYPGWNPGDELQPFSAVSCALTQNENCQLVRVTPGSKPGQAVSVELEPKSAYPRVENHGLTAGQKKPRSRLAVTRQSGTDTIEVSGELSLRSGPSESLLPLSEPALSFAYSLAQALSEEGVILKGKVRVTYEPYRAKAGETPRILASWHSAELRELVSQTNKKSNNLSAEQLFKTLAAHELGFGSREKGTQVVGGFMGSAGLEPGEQVVADGSGLSRLDKTTPYATILVLRIMFASPFFKDYLDSLPVAGVDGTLQRRMRGSRAENVVHAKTGTLKGASSLSGYVTGKDGKVYAFSIMLNDFANPHEARALQDEICAVLGEYSG